MPETVVVPQAEAESADQEGSATYVYGELEADLMACDRTVAAGVAQACAVIDDWEAERRAALAEAVAKARQELAPAARPWFT